MTLKDIAKNIDWSKKGKPQDFFGDTNENVTDLAIITDQAGNIISFENDATVDSSSFTRKYWNEREKTNTPAGVECSVCCDIALSDIPHF